MYLHLGAQTELSVSKLVRDQTALPQDVLIALERWSDKQPDSGQVLFMLGDRYLALGKNEKALDAYRRLYEVTNGASQAASELAQALYVIADYQATDEVRDYYREALGKDELNAAALGLKGIDAFAQEQYEEAIQAWSQALRVEASREARQKLSEGINEARHWLGQPSVELRVQVKLSPELQNLPGETRVFVFARDSVEGQQPIAVIPMTVADLPHEFILDDRSTTIMGGGSLSDIDRLDIIARVSLSGDVSQADFQTEIKSVDVSKQDAVKIYIEAVSS